MNRVTLDGRCAIVTGAGRGLGRSVAEALAAEGADVVLISRTERELADTADRIERTGRRALPVAADVSDRTSVERAVAAALNAFAAVDILVNSAGIQGPIGPLADNDPDEWSRTISVNLLGAFHAMRAVLPHMTSRRRGKVVNVSGGGATAPRPAFSAYAASKAALVRLTETVAREVAPFDVQVNAIAPGRMRTAMSDAIVAAGPAAGAEAHSEPADEATLERATDLVVYLASGRSGTLTGKLISAPHDPWREWAGRAEELNASPLYTLRRLDPYTLRPLLDRME